MHAKVYREDLCDAPVRHRRADYTRTSYNLVTEIAFVFESCFQFAARNPMGGVDAALHHVACFLWLEFFRGVIRLFRPFLFDEFEARAIDHGKAVAVLAERDERRPTGVRF